MTGQNMDTRNVPLILDVDGTFLKTDLLAESFRALLLQKPAKAFAALQLIGNRAAFKQYVAENITLDIAKLPVNKDILAIAKQARVQGRRVYLASASDRIYIEPLARHYPDLFDGVFASNGAVNLKGETKAKVLCDAFGAGGFDYAGDSLSDFPVWQKARKVIVVSNTRSVSEKVALQFPQALILEGHNGLIEHMKAMRIHQWSKNLLIFVPTIMAHLLAPSQLLPALIAFFSFSFCASSVYLLNDWFDIDSDRQHPEKQHRTFASGNLSVIRGMQLILLLLALSLALALQLPKEFVITLTAYYSLTLAYSLWLKHLAIIDVIVLACLYGIRIISGAALGVHLSEWLVVFSFFLFLGLAMVKRCAELINCAAEGKDRPAGRGYILGDIPAAFCMATASSYVAVLVLAFYIQSPEVKLLYTYPKHLWGACVILTYWVSRVLMLTSRGEMHEDPVIFAMTDRASLICGALLGALIWTSV
jgi:4-hydroxybenzoate polyprenyltransferase/phosphoserine phosphatase